MCIFAHVKHGRGAGPAGPNSVSASTATAYNGLLKGNGTNVATAVAGTDYQAPLTLPLSLANGGTGSATQNFVDLSSTQTVGGAKTLSATLTSQTVTPSANATYALGDTTHYYSNAYASTLNLNSTASIDGGTPGTLAVTGALGILATSGAATHSLTLGSAATGLALYNTSDQTTNYERVVGAWSANVWQLFSSAAGTGTARKMQIGDSGGYLDFNGGAASGGAKFTYTRNSNTSGSLFNVTTTAAALTGGAGITQYGIKINPTYNQTSTASGVDLLVDRTETAVGSGVQSLIDLRVAGTSLLSVSNKGVLFPVKAPTASAPAYVKGGIYFDTTLNKLRVGGATAWETITSS